MIDTDWVVETRQKQDKSRSENSRSAEMRANLSALAFSDLRQALPAHVRRINQTYPEVYSRDENRDLRLAGGRINRLEVTCGPNLYLEVEFCANPERLKVRRRDRRTEYGPKMGDEVYYFFKLDKLDELRLEARDGTPIPLDLLPRELLSFLTAGL